jgi:hypothetical protein
VLISVRCAPSMRTPDLLDGVIRIRGVRRGGVIVAAQGFGLTALSQSGITGFVSL